MGQYATVANMRSQGASGTDERILTALEDASRTIDRLTGLFFEQRSDQTYELDGSGIPVLELPAPCLALTSVEIDGVEVASANLVNRNRPPGEADDYWYPRLEWKSSSGAGRLQRGFNRGRAVWPRGEQNVEVVGDFGFVVASWSPTGALVTPPDIVRACVMLASLWLGDLASQSATQDRAERFLQSESIGNYSYSFGSGAGAGRVGNAAMTGDADIDAILARYTRAMQGF